MNWIYFQKLSCGVSHHGNHSSPVIPLSAVKCVHSFIHSTIGWFIFCHHFFSSLRFFFPYFPLFPSAKLSILLEYFVFWANFLMADWIFSVFEIKYPQGERHSQKVLNRYRWLINRTKLAKLKKKKGEKEIIRVASCDEIVKLPLRMENPLFTSSWIFVLCVFYFSIFFSSSYLCIRWYFRFCWFGETKIFQHRLIIPTSNAFETFAFLSLRFETGVTYLFK